MKRNLEKYRYIYIMLLLMILCWLFPYTGDDWAWGSRSGLERLATGFENYNGRYVGNMIVLALTRSNLLKTVVMAFSITGIIYLIERMIGDRMAFYVAAVLLALMPKGIFKQAVVWTSGFSNYVTSCGLTMIFLAYIWRVFERKSAINLKQNFFVGVLLFILGVSNALIMEHLTIYNLVVGCFVFIFVFIRFRKVFIQHILYFLGTVVGTAIMFSNEVYHTIAKDSDGYRSVVNGVTALKTLADNAKVVYRELCMNNVWLNAVLLVICILIFCSLKKRENGNLQRLMAVCIYIMGIYVVYAFFSNGGIGDTTRRDGLYLLEGIGTLIYLAAVFVFVMLAAVSQGHTWKFLFIFGSIACMTAPLFVVKPIGSRCFFSTYVMFVVLICELLTVLRETEPEIAAYAEREKMCWRWLLW